MSLPAPDVLDNLAAMLDAEKGCRSALQAVMVRGDSKADCARETHDKIRGYIVEAARAIVARADAP